MSKTKHRAQYETTDTTYTLLKKEMLYIGRFDWVIYKKGASKEEALTWRKGELK
jgi:hypothetical protein